MRLRVGVLRILSSDFGNRQTLFLILFGAGFVCHGYELFSKRPNYDEFISMFHYGGGYRLGRWFLSLLGNLVFRISGCYSLPWLGGLLFLALLSAAAVVFLRAFSFENRFAEALAGILFLVFPSQTATLTYLFTAPYYAFAVLLAAAAFYLTVRFRWGFAFGAVLLCFSMGIYQAYFCLIAALLLVLVLIFFLKEKTDPKEGLFLIGKGLCMLIAGMGLYLVINRVMLAWKGTELSEYQGIANMGKASGASIISATGLAYRRFFTVFAADDGHLFPYALLRACVWICMIVSLFLIARSVLRLVREKAEGLPIRLAMVLLCLILLPFGINLIFLMGSENPETVHMLMRSASFLMLALPLFLWEVSRREESENPASGAARSAGHIPAETAGPEGTPLIRCGRILTHAALILSIFLYIKFANTVYLSYEIRYEQMYAFFQTLETRIQSVPGYDATLPLIFVGTYTGDESLWEFADQDDTTGHYRISYVVNYGDMRANIFRIFFGYRYPETLPDETLLAGEAFRSMPVYPNDGSIRIINDTIVVKFSD
ncbi:MAG: glucosyltransferase domain-containing protein [Lachnospiraceae bacterium]|nr:glucosyltransferase domain-containing protein [Lachnospiraceae bacterium]